jgi:phosphoenolpyruvate carboxykinase (ATP)
MTVGHDASNDTKTNVYRNLSSAELVQIALEKKEGVLASNQAFVATTGPRTGRSPKDRFIVKDSITELTVDWNTINQPISGANFDALWQRAMDYLHQKDYYFVTNLSVAADPTLPCRSK